MSMTSFQFDPSLTREFIDFGYSLYRDDRRRIPPIRRSVARQFSPDYPFYNKQGNGHKHFLAYQGRRVVGRVSAMVNAALRDHDGTAVGLIGFYECREDEAAAAALLDAARNWLREEHGLRRIWGPMNFDTWHGYRFLTKGFDRAPFYGEPDNKSYYPDQFERYGFVRRRTWNSIEISGRPQLESLIARGKDPYALLLDRGYRFVPPGGPDRRNDLRKLHALISRSFDGFLGFTPIAFEEFERLFDRLRHALARPMSMFIYDEADRLVGFGVTLYELSEAVRAMKGRDHPLSLAKFLFYRRRARRLNFFAAGVVPEERAKGTGIGKAGLYYVVDRALRHGCQDIIFALMAKENRVQGLFRQAGLDAQREYALYELNI
jgi:GNAT superfamily N-acetyltransferase